MTDPSQSTLTCPNSTMETPEQWCKTSSKLTIKTPN